MPLLAIDQLGATAFEVGIINSAGFIAYPMLGLVVGVYVDRWQRRRVLLAADLGRAVITGLVVVLALLGRLAVWQLCVLALAIGLLTLFFDVAHQAYLPQVVSKDKLVAGNSKLVGTTSTVRLAGPSIGGALVQSVGSAIALIVDAISFVASFFAVKSIREIKAPDHAAAPAKVRTQLAEGIRYLRDDAVLRSFLVTNAQLNLLLTAEQTLWVLFLVRTLDASPFQVGLLFAAGGTGAILGSLLAPQLVRRYGTAATLRIGISIGPILGMLIPFAGRGAGLLLFAVGSAGLSLGGNIFNIVVGSYRQASVPSHLLGRVVATMRTATLGPLPVGALLGGFLGDLLGLRTALIAIAVALLTAPMWLIFTPVWRMSAADLLRSGSQSSST